MKTYAIVNKQGVVENAVLAADASPFIAAGLQAVEANAVGPGWTYKNGIFSPPPEPELTATELRAAAENEKQARLQAASVTIAPLADAIEFDIATVDERQRYDAWRRYRVLLSRIDPNDAPDITWPPTPE